MSSIRSSTDAQCVCHIQTCTLEKMSILDIFRNFYNIFSCCVSRSESELVPMMMDSLLTLPPGTHVAVQATVLDLLAELAPWINKHSEFLGTASMCVCVCVCVCLCHYLSAIPLPSPPSPSPRPCSGLYPGGAEISRSLHTRSLCHSGHMQCLSGIHEAAL